MAQLYPKIASRAHMTPDEISKISWEKVAQKLPSVRLNLSLFTFLKHPGSVPNGTCLVGTLLLISTRFQLLFSITLARPASA